MYVQDTEPELFLFDCLFGHKFRWLVFNTSWHNADHVVTFIRCCLPYPSTEENLQLIFPWQFWSVSWFCGEADVFVAPSRFTWEFWFNSMAKTAYQCSLMNLQVTSCQVLFRGFYGSPIYLVLYSIAQWILMDVFLGGFWIEGIHIQANVNFSAGLWTYLDLPIGSMGLVYLPAFSLIFW